MSYKNKEREKLYWVWDAMKSRCFDSSDPAYVNYGGRGIGVSREWLTFENFLFDMGPRPTGSSLDRIDNNAGYGSLNCRWATRREQNGNRRNCIIVTFQGKTVNLKEACRVANIKYRPVHKRLERGWDISRALSTPIGKGNTKCA